MFLLFSFVLLFYASHNFSVCGYEKTDLSFCTEFCPTCGLALWDEPRKYGDLGKSIVLIASCTSRNSDFTLTKIWSTDFSKASSLMLIESTAIVPLSMWSMETLKSVSLGWWFVFSKANRFLSSWLMFLWSRSTLEHTLPLHGIWLAGLLTLIKQESSGMVLFSFFSVTSGSGS